MRYAGRVWRLSKLVSRGGFLACQGYMVTLAVMPHFQRTSTEEGGTDSPGLPHHSVVQSDAAQRK